MITNFTQLIKAVQACSVKEIAVVFPNNYETLSAVIEAAEKKIARFVLVGDRKIIRKFVFKRNLPASSVEIVHRPTISEVLETVIELAKKEEIQIILKGGIDTSTMMKSVFWQPRSIPQCNRSKTMPMLKQTWLQNGIGFCRSFMKRIPACRLKSLNEHE